MSFSDTLMAYKILKGISQKWTEFDAYELGIIDDRGSKIKSPETDEEKESYNSYYRMIINLKRLLQRFVGKNPSIQKLTSLLLLKEKVDQDSIDIILRELNLPSDTESISESRAKLILERFRD